MFSCGLNAVLHRLYCDMISFWSNDILSMSLKFDVSTMIAIYKSEIDTGMCYSLKVSLLWPLHSVGPVSMWKDSEKESTEERQMRAEKRVIQRPCWNTALVWRSTANVWRVLACCLYVGSTMLATKSNVNILEAASGWLPSSRSVNCLCATSEQIFSLSSITCALIFHRIYPSLTSSCAQKLTVKPPTCQ